MLQQSKSSPVGSIIFKQKRWAFFFCSKKIQNCASIFLLYCVTLTLAFGFELEWISNFGLALMKPELIASFLILRMSKRICTQLNQKLGLESGLILEMVGFRIQRLILKHWEFTIYFPYRTHWQNKNTYAFCFWAIDLLYLQIANDHNDWECLGGNPLLHAK